METALAHDYLTQPGGAERVVEVMARAFPGAPVYTALYNPRTTFPEIATLDVRPSPLNRLSPLRRNHRLALPLLAGAVSQVVVDADVLLASSSGWAHGIVCTGRKIVYCHAPARWLYQRDRYVGQGRAMALSQRMRRTASLAALGAIGDSLRAWDRRAAASADRYLVNSTLTQRAVREIYGIESEVLAPPPALLPAGAEKVVAGVEAPYLLCVARLLPYKNVDIVIDAVRRAGNFDLVIVGDGPDRARLEGLRSGDSRVHILGRVSDAEIRWLYRNCAALVAASFEDYGLSPLEAATFGRPTVALRDGGFLDTVDEGRTGLFFDQPRADALATALDELTAHSWDEAAIRAHAEGFGADHFVRRLRAVVAEELLLR